MDTKASNKPALLTGSQLELVSAGLLAIYSAVNGALFHSATSEAMRRHVNALERCEEGGICP
ncbi:MAG: hypothetical protein H6950_10980 [Zoogloeaceae bacterium]|nr:hypothetical protein [Zoogloeaceae bacterium]MCP5254545.1 hypothetical protein [Zoogloeaceae bacterium]MCP5295208.1 hypothetical protein [Zoogloeaceae bacterium]MCW5613849.1 hypothetical protein [Rhodocyclaceae bacterium]